MNILFLQSVPNSAAGSGWVPGVGPPTVGSPDSGAKKRAPPFDYEENGPSPSKRRLRDEDQDDEGGYNSEDEYNHLGTYQKRKEWKCVQHHDILSIFRSTID